MQESGSKNNPAFLEDVFKLNKGSKLGEALPLNRIGLKTYQKDKWTIHQIIQHLIDWERIWCFRAVIFARGESAIPIAHDQDIMGSNSNANELSIEQLVNELRAVRQSTIMMFESFNEKILKTNCVFFEYEMPLFTIGLTITAHQIHHLKIIQDRYLPLDK